MRERVAARPSSLNGPIQGAFRRGAAVRVIALLALACFWLAGAPDATAKYAAFVIDANTGRTLYADGADVQNHPASLTKMMTLYLLFEDLQAGHITLRSPLTVTARAERQPPSSLGLHKGQIIPVHTAIEALVIKSANDVAVTVAENLAGSEVLFAQRMTAKARQLGMSRTTFRNASGLHHRAQLTTARDLARLALALQHDFPKYYKYFALKEFDFDGQTISTHNNLLKSYPGADGLKTGFIQASGFNLAASAVRGGHRLIAVVMGGNTARWRDHRTAGLLDRGFQEIAFADNRLPRPPMNPENPRALASLSGEGEERVAALALPAGVGEGDTDAAALPEPAPERPRTVAARPGAWGIQVGAFSDRAAAEGAARHAMAMQTDAAAARAQSRIEPLKAKTRTLYRARIIGLSSGDANRACTLIQREAKPCMVIKP
ncbi:D-alanyl-D-alanine carboxypeptidase family protein [Oleispirillum naphthae]|uniref:D-alanyl-D-alanine carboxypeptidase family protein n=1 Tax=Oleispirillum naphthae TaxID=2838853 RepID=UPI00308241BF